MSTSVRDTEGIAVKRWASQSIGFSLLLAIFVVALAFAPLVLGAEAIDRLTVLFVYVLLACMWNALAGYGGLVSIGQQAFFGLGAYALIRLSATGMNVYVALGLSVVLVGLVAIPLGQVMLRLRGGEFAIGMWVLAELLRLLVTIDPITQGATGTSLIAINTYAPDARRAFTYWSALVLLVFFLAILFFMLRGRIGASLQAIRDDETAASSIGVDVFRTKNVLFLLSGAGCAAAGAIWLAQSVTFQPAAYFSPQWTAYMLFMTIVGGLGTFEGPVIGAVLFFLAETYFGSTGVAYLIGLGGLAVGFALLFPKGIWGAIESRFPVRLIPIGYHLQLPRLMPRTTNKRQA